MQGALTELAKRVARQNEADLEEQLAAAVSRHLGGKNWEWGELVGRLQAVIGPKRELQLYLLDNTPILRVISRVEVEDVLVINSRVYEQL